MPACPLLAFALKTCGAAAAARVKEGRKWPQYRQGGLAVGVSVAIRDHPIHPWWWPVGIISVAGWRGSEPLAAVPQIVIYDV